jgi:hypothetical protein
MRAMRDSNKRASERANEQTSERASERTNERKRKVEQLLQIHVPFRSQWRSSRCCMPSAPPLGNRRHRMQIQSTNKKRREEKRRPEKRAKKKVWRKLKICNRCGGCSVRPTDCHGDHVRHATPSVRPTGGGDRSILCCNWGGGQATITNRRPCQHLP